jgi:hypothetical protein
MIFLFFWIKVTGKIINSFFRQYRLTIIGTIVIVFSLIIAGINTILYLDTIKCIVIVSLFTITSLIFSLKHYNLMPVLILYSKSNITYKIIRVIFFTKKTFRNNIPILLLNVIIITGVIRVDQYFFVQLFSVFSFLCCLLVMILKNNRKNKEIQNKKTHTKHINASVKSMVYDYVTNDFFQGAVIAISLFLLVFIEAIKTKNILWDQNTLTLFFTALAVIVSFGFSGILDSIPNINWKYYAIVSPQSFSYHFRKTALFLLCVFILPLAAFVILVLYFNIALIFVNLYYIIILFIFSINIAFISGNIIAKGIIFIIVVMLTLWISLSRIYLLPLLLIPVVLSLSKAKTDYRKRYCYDTV